VNNKEIVTTLGYDVRLERKILIEWFNLVHGHVSNPLKGWENSNIWEQA
jgi:hypothetical protein